MLKIQVLWAVALCPGRVKLYTLTLTMKALRPFEISIIIDQCTRYNTPEEFNLKVFLLMG
jgi:hypothetical protein